MNWNKELNWIVWYNVDMCVCVCVWYNIDSTAIRLLDCVELKIFQSLSVWASGLNKLAILVNPLVPSMDKNPDDDRD